MLARSHRLTTPAQFRTAVRSGRRAGGPLVVLHLAATSSPDQPRVGFVVSKAVGGAVVRNRVKRRLREILRGRLALLPLGSLTVVRAQPQTSTATYADLESAVDRQLRRLIGEAA